MKTSWESLTGKILEEQLRHASYHGLAQHLDKLMQTNLDIFKPGPNGKTALHWAVMGGRLEIVQKLMQSYQVPKNQIDAQDYAEQSALHLACKKNNYPICQVLLNAGANPLLKDCFGRSCFDLATESSVKSLLLLYSNLVKM